MKVAVIGAGVMGLAAGRALKQRGHEIVVYEHGGSIAVRSNQGEFSEFIVRLPRVGPVAKAEIAVGSRV